MVGVSLSPTRVVLAEDEVLLREGLASLLERAGFDVVGQCGEPSELLGLVREHRPELAIIDIRMPPTHTREGLDAARVIREEAPETAILVLSAHVQIEQATDLLASGERERDVLSLMAEGRSNAGIAHQLWVTEGTVRADRPRLISSRLAA
jgi:DNA-binding NarL/FixJ family response regulator